MKKNKKIHRCWFFFNYLPQMQQQHDCASEYAKLHGLGLDELETIAEMAPFVARGPKAQFYCAPREEECYRVRFEAAEARYNRMKALVCASLEAQMRMKSNARGRLAVQTLHELGLGDAEAIERMIETKSPEQPSLQKLMHGVCSINTELRAVKEENAKLIEVNRVLRGERRISVAEETTASIPDVSDEVELKLARERIFALELELNRLNDHRFEEDMRLREYESVFHSLLGRAVPSDTAPPVCSNPDCNASVRRLRAGMKQAIADAYVRDRTVRIHGFFRRVAEPVESVKVRTDKEILALRLRLKRLEQAACMTSSEADAMQLDTQIVDMRLKVENMRSDGERIRAEIVSLNAERDQVKCVIEGLRTDEDTVRKSVQEGLVAKAQVELTMEAFHKQQREMELFLKRAEQFQSGKLRLDVEEKYRELERLENEIAIMEDNKYKVEHGVGSVDGSDDEMAEESNVKK